MANKEHVSILKQGSSVWNTWRKEHQEVWPDLSRANLRNVHLNRADLRQADLRQASLRQANFSGIDHNETGFMRESLKGAILRRFTLNEEEYHGADLSVANLSTAHLSGATLIGTNLSGAILRRADLSSADLREAMLRRTDLSDADLSKANLTRADFSDANLTRTILNHAVMDKTSLGDRDLREIKGLQTVIHSGPSPLSVNTIFLSQGSIPEAFLRGTGTPDTFIEYMHSLTNQPIQYYTCFISYANEDQECAEQLYTDLQSQGVRCWYAPHDMRPGDLIRERIDEAIRMYDKLLFILSKHSVESAWVRFKVEAALEQEVQRDKLVLFPVRLDETVITTTRAWAAGLRRERHIGNFTEWKHHDHYQQQLTDLLRHLQSQEKPPQTT